jgi:hypothetical protein
MTRPTFPQTDPLEVTRQIYRQAFALRAPVELDALIAFVTRFRRFSMFNSALIHAQRPDAQLLASAVQWARHERTVVDGARPIVVLAPFGPVQFLFDERDTHGRPLGEMERSALLAPAAAPRADWEGLVDSARALGVVVEAGQIPDGRTWTLAAHVDRGHARGEGRCIGWELPVNGALDAGARLLRLFHELGHIYCGHLGGHPAGAWRSRRDVPAAEREAEAELVCQLVCARAGRDGPPLRHLQLFMEERNIATVDLGAVIHAADLIESRGSQERARTRRQRSADPLPGQIGMFQ